MIRNTSSEYRRNFTNPTEARRKFPLLNGVSLQASSEAPAHLAYQRSVSSSNLMGEWLRRTKTRPYLSFQENVPSPAELPAPSPKHPPSAYQRYIESYEKLMKRLAETQGSKTNISRKLLTSGGKGGGWRHIKETYGAGTNLISWLDGSVTIEESQPRGDSAPVQPRFKEWRFTGGKGPNRHIRETYGAGTNNFVWLDGGTDALRRYKRIQLPTIYHQQNPV